VAGPGGDTSVSSLYGSEPATATTTFIGGVYTFQN